MIVQGVLNRFLVVEDEETLRGLVREILQLEGYQVLEAAHPEAARRICAEYHGEIDLLLTDVTMPRMSGPGLSCRVRELLDVPQSFPAVAAVG